MTDCEYEQLDPKTGKVCPKRSRQHKAGDVLDCPPDYANRWLRRGKASEVEDDPAPSPAPKSKVTTA